MFKYIKNPIVLLISICVLSTLLFVHHQVINPMKVPLIDDQNNQPTTLATQLKPNDKSLIIFWSSWCRQCNDQFNTVDQLKKQHPNLNVIAIQVDDEPNNTAKLHNYINLKAQKNSEFLMDKLGHNSERLPLSVIIGNNGQILQALSGATDLKQLTHALYKQRYKVQQ